MGSYSITIARTAAGYRVTQSASTSFDAIERNSVLYGELRGPGIRQTVEIERRNNTLVVSETFFFADGRREDHMNAFTCTSAMKK